MKSGAGLLAKQGRGRSGPPRAFASQKSSPWRYRRGNRRPGRRPASGVESGRAMARTGLRMMPTFPSPSLKFRTAGFPQYGFKAGLSDGAFPGLAPVKPAPGIPFAPPGLPPSFVRSVATCYPRSVSRAFARVRTAARKATASLPQGPSLRSRLFCPGPSSLNRPHPPHSQARRDFAAVRVIRDALAVRERLGDPRVVPRFR
jgi:hypothetical protein